MPKDMHSDTTVHITDGQPVMLPGHDVITDAQFIREGADLFLSTPDGYTVKVEGYFSHNPPPALDTPDGKHLSPDMVSAFLTPTHPAQYADATHTTTATDASPVGKITQVVGKAEIIHPDGSHTAATLNAAVHQGDVIQTADKGGVNILFLDNTTFAISENARMSVDEFTYHPADHSGSTFFSMLQGMFVYTSGLIGKHDPGHVNIDTPVGSIGIRGTVVAGDIHAAGQDSHITIVDGAIVVTNDGGSVQLDHTFGTAVLNNFSSAPTNAGQLSAQSFTTTYDGVHSVAGSTFDAVSDGTYHTTTTPDTTTPSQTTDPTHGMLQLPGDIITNPDVQQAPQTGSLFGHDTTAFTDGTSSFDAAATSTTPGTLAATTTDSGSTHTTGGTTTGSTTTAPVDAALHSQLNFSAWYNADGGIPLFNLALPGQAVTPTTTLGSVTGPAGTDHFALTISSNVLDHTSGSAYDTHTALINDALTIGSAVSGTAAITINNPYAMASFINSGLTFTVDAYDASGNILSSDNFSAAFDSSTLHASHGQTYIGDPNNIGSSSLTSTPLATTEFIYGTSGNDLLYNRAGDDTLTSNGGYDTMLGGSGKENFVLTTSQYQYIYGGGGGGTDTLTVSGGSSLDLTSHHNVYGIAKVELNNTTDNSITLSLQDVLNMTADSGGTQVDIFTATGGSGTETVHVVGAVGTSGFSDNESSGVRTITGTYNSQSVTLVIHNADSGHGAITTTVS